MWVSSSAFEKSLNSSFCLDPSVYGWRVDPHGKYVKKYIPELAEMPVEFIYAPWRAPLEVACIQYLGISKHRHSGLWTINYNICFQIQKTANCIIGRDYPSPIVDHKSASQHNSRNMEELQKLMDGLEQEAAALGINVSTELEDVQGMVKFWGVTSIGVRKLYIAVTFLHLFVRIFK